MGSSSFHPVAAAGIAVVCASVLSGGVWLLGLREGPAPHPMGDQLGPDPGEDLSAYREHARDSLVSAPADERAFALVSFKQKLAPEEASAAVARLLRVNAVVVDSSAPLPVGEPAQLTHEATGRGEVFGAVVQGMPISGVVAWDDGDSLRLIAGDERVDCVEVLPPDAVWGTFGIRPLPSE